MTDQQDSPAGQGARDAEIVRAYLAGDRSALASVYDCYGQSLYDTAAAMTGSRDDAADMVQDVFVLAAERLDQLRDPTRLKPWLFAILRNEVYRRSRRRSRNVVTDFSAPERDVVLPPTQADTDVVDDEIDYAEVAELVRGAARGLDARDQLVLELSVRQGLSGADLADALGVSAQQSYGLVHRMRERTERSLSAYCVARKGRKECDELDGILKGWDGDFSVLLRKRVARHIETCNTCERTRRRFAPIALVGAAPAFAAPIELRDRIIEHLDLLHPVSSSQSSGATNGSAATTTFSSSNGFPLLQGAARTGRRVALMLSGAAATVLIGAGALLFTGGTEPPADAGPPPSVVTPPTGPLGDPGGTAVVPDSTTTSAPQTTIATTPTETPTTSEAASTTAPPTTLAAPTTTELQVAVSPNGTAPATTAAITLPSSTSPTTTLTTTTTSTTTPVTTTTTVPTTTTSSSTTAPPTTTTPPTTAPPTTTTPPTTTPPTTTAPPRAPEILSAPTSMGPITLPSECVTEVRVTIDINDVNDDPMTVVFDWNTSEGTPNQGTVTYSNLASGEHNLLLGTFDYTHRLTTLFVRIEVTDPSGGLANWGFQAEMDSGGECPSVFG